MNGKPNKGEPGQAGVSDNAPAPGTGEPGKEPAPGKEPTPGQEPGKEPTPGKEPAPGTPPTKVDFLSQKLDGENVPEKLRGKTVQEALEIAKLTEGELSKANQEIATWHKYYEAVKTREASGGEAPEDKKPDFLKHFDEEQAGAIVGLVNEVMKPVFDAVGGMQLSYVKAVRPDFETVEERAREIYKNFPLSYKMHPDYGYDFAYRFAKAEAEGGPPPQGPPVPHAGESQVGTPPTPAEEPLTPEQEEWRRRYNMSVEEYKKFMNIIDIDKME